MFGYFKKARSPSPFMLTRLFGLANDEQLLIDQLNRLTRQWMTDHGLSPASFGQLHANLFGMDEGYRAQLTQHLSERLFHIMLHDPMMSPAAASMLRLLGTCERAAVARPGGYKRADIVRVTPQHGGSCNRCALPLTFDHCKACGLVDDDIIQFSHARKL